MNEQSVYAGEKDTQVIVDITLNHMGYKLNEINKFIKAQKNRSTPQPQ